MGGGTVLNAPAESLTHLFKHAYGGRAECQAASDTRETQTRVSHTLRHPHR